MGKRFTDTNKYKKAFYRNLPGAYKLFWDFLYHDCDHAGIWIIDEELAQKYVGKDMPITLKIALEYFNEDEVRIIPFDRGKKWFIPTFISFQYGKLSEKNRAHVSAIEMLKSFNLLNEDLSPINKLPKPLWEDAKGDKDKDKDKDKDMDKDIKELYKKLKNENIPENDEQKKILFMLVLKMIELFKKYNPKYFFSKETDYTACLQIAYKIAETKKWKNNEVLNGKMDETLVIWEKIVSFVKNDVWFQTRSLSDINSIKEWQRLTQKMKAAKDNELPANTGSKVKPVTQEDLDKYSNKK